MSDWRSLPKKCLTGPTLLEMRWSTAAILVGYGIAEYVDQRQTRKARDEIFENEVLGWEASEDHPEYEDKGVLTRVRLTGNNQILATRIAELLVRMR